MNDGELERSLFGPADARAAIRAFVADHVGEPVDELLYVAGVGLVIGLRLADGRQVVVKVHRWNVSIERLTAVQAVQTHLADLGLPMPRPLVPAQELGEGLVTVEELLTGGRVDGRTPESRRAMAEGLHRLIHATAGVDAAVGRAGVMRPEGAPLWMEPHDLRFDFDATAAGAEWIDELAEQARRRLDLVDQPDRIGHFDWRVQNVAFTDGELSAIYDSDSLGTAPEAVIVGCAAGCFCIDWEAGVDDPPPTPAMMRAFVADYEAARGRPFDDDERDAADAANLMQIAYGSRSQHSDLFLQPELGDTREIGWFRLLGDRGERCL